MKALQAITIWQPWATLIAAGVKPYEFRRWPVRRSLVGERIAIHAGARKVRGDEVCDLLNRLNSATAWTTGLREGAEEILRRAWRCPASLPLSSVVCTAVVGEPIRSTRITHEFGGPVINDSDRDEHANWAWPLSDIQRVEPPQPARGRQGFWIWKPEPIGSDA